MLCSQTAGASPVRLVHVTLHAAPKRRPSEALSPGSGHRRCAVQRFCALWMLCLAQMVRWFEPVQDCVGAGGMHAEARGTRT